MGFLGALLSIVGGIFGGPIGAAAGGAIGGLASGGGIQGAVTGGLGGYLGGAFGGGLGDVAGGAIGNSLGGGLAAGADGLGAIAGGFGASGGEFNGGGGYGGNYNFAQNFSGDGGFDINDQFSGGDTIGQPQLFGSAEGLGDLASNSFHGDMTEAPGAGHADVNNSSSYIDELRKRLGLTKGGPFSTALNIGSGLYGLSQAQKLRSIASQAAATQDPFAAQRAQYGQKLNDLYANPSNVQALPGYQAGIDAVTRKMASQGYLGSGNMMAALQDYGGNAFNAEAARLSGLAGAGFAPTGGQVRVAGNVGANNLAGISLASLGYGARGLEDLAGGGR